MWPTLIAKELPWCSSPQSDQCDHRHSVRRNQCTNTIYTGKTSPREPRAQTSEDNRAARQVLVAGLQSCPRSTCPGLVRIHVGHPQTLRDVERESWKTVFFGEPRLRITKRMLPFC